MLIQIKRSDSWLRLLRLQLPSSLANYGPISRVTLSDRDVNGIISFGEGSEKLSNDATVFVKNETKLNQMLPGNQILKSLALRAKVELDDSSVSGSGENVKHSVWSVRIEMPKHIVIFAASGSRAHEGHIEHKKGSTGTVLNMEKISPQVTPKAPQRANASCKIFYYRKAAASRCRGAQGAQMSLQNAGETDTIGEETFSPKEELENGRAREGT